MQQDKHNLMIVIASIIGLTAVALFLINKHQLQTISGIADIFNSASTSTASRQNENSQAEQIAKLQQQIDELKAQQASQEKQSMFKPTLPSVDLKTQAELNKAQEQIRSLTQQLSQLQIQGSPTPSPTVSVASQNDADLLKSWQASEKVVQVACPDKALSNNWQMGSGVLISADGKILTNLHVVQSSLSMTMPDYCLVLFAKDFNNQTQTYTKQYRATIAGYFQDRDASLLKINDVLTPNSNGTPVSLPAPGEFPYFQVASVVPQIGDPVYVLGFPESANFAFSVTKGIISNLSSDGLYFGTDAQIDRGNSGGAALNSSGQLVGLPTYKFVSSGDYRGYVLNIQTINIE